MYPKKVSMPEIRHFNASAGVFKQVRTGMDEKKTVAEEVDGFSDGFGVKRTEEGLVPFEYAEPEAAGSTSFQRIRRSLQTSSNRDG